MQPGDVIVRSGTYVYEETALGEFRIVRTTVRSTLGNPEWQSNAPGPWFEVEYTSAGVRDRFTNSAVGFESLAEAVKWVVASFSGVAWLN